jgi:adenylosuccinate synthase
MFCPRRATLLSRFMLIEPYAMINEGRHLPEVGVSEPFGRFVHSRRLSGDHAAAQQAASLLRDFARGKGAHGTCGMVCRRGDGGFARGSGADLRARRAY